MKSRGLLLFLLLLPLCLQFRLLLASHPHFHVHRSSSSIPGGVEILSAENVAAVNRKGGGGGGRGGHAGGARGIGGGGGGITPFYGRNGGSRRSNGRHRSGSNRFVGSVNLNVVAFVFTVFTTSMLV